MNTTPESFTPLNAPDASTHVFNQIDNPCARIYCRSRRLRPTLCDGTCQGCRKEREAYIKQKIDLRLEQARANPSFGESPDHSDEVPDYEGVRKIVLSEIEALDRRKVGVLRAAFLLSQEIATHTDGVIHPHPDQPLPGDTTDSTLQSFPK